MTGIIFAPLLFWAVIWGLAAVAALLVVFALSRGLAGWALRGLAAGVLVLALAGPSLQQEDRKPLPDIVLLVVDESASQGLGDRVNGLGDDELVRQFCHLS
jgi:hypothetical protein